MFMNMYIYVKFKKQKRENMVFVLLAPPYITCFQLHAFPCKQEDCLLLKKVVMYKYHIFVIHSSVVGYSDLSHNLAIVNCSIINIGVYKSLSKEDLRSFMSVPRSDVAGSHER